MLLKNKVAVIYGAGGIIGGAVARAFARAGAELYLAGRTRAKLDAVARDVIAGGGRAEAEEVDALDERAVQQHTDAVAAQAGCIDIALNAVGIVHVQGTPLAELSLEDYSRPIVAYTQTNFITAKAVARHMMKQGSGAILSCCRHRRHECQGLDSSDTVCCTCRNRSAHTPSCRRGRRARRTRSVRAVARDSGNGAKRLACSGSVRPDCYARGHDDRCHARRCRLGDVAEAAAVTRTSRKHHAVPCLRSLGSNDGRRSEPHLRDDSRLERRCGESEAPLQTSIDRRGSAARGCEIWARKGQ